MRTRTRTALIAGIAIAMPTVVFGTIWWPEPRAYADRLVVDLGYLELTPPSRLFLPGTFTTVEELSDGSVQLHLACRMDAAALRKRSLVSPTINVKFIQKVSRSIRASAHLLGEMATEATGNRVRNVSGAIGDLQIHTMSYQDLDQVRSEYLKGACEQAIIDNLQTGARVCQLEEVLQGDLTYRLAFADGVEVEEKGDLVEVVTALANFKQAKSLTNDVYGDDLLLGIKAKLRCLTINVGQIE